MYPTRGRRLACAPDWTSTSTRTRGLDPPSSRLPKLHLTITAAVAPVYTCKVAAYSPGSPLLTPHDLPAIPTQYTDTRPSLSHPGKLRAHTRIGPLDRPPAAWPPPNLLGFAPTRRLCPSPRPVLSPPRNGLSQPFTVSPDCIIPTGPFYRRRHALSRRRRASPQSVDRPASRQHVRPRCLSPAVTTA